MGHAVIENKRSMMPLHKTKSQLLLSVMAPVDTKPYAL